VEVSRKHGPFDTRWPCVRKDGSDVAPAVSLPAAEVAEALDWDAFSARYFGERSRHDSEARSAYAAYKRGEDWRKDSQPEPPRLHLVPTGPVPAAEDAESEAVGVQSLLAAVAAVQTWEGEGGYTR
jgi:hypothetical protein